MTRSRLVLAGLACALTMSCFQVEQNTTLYPDGSGRFVFNIAIGKSLMEMAKMGASMGKESQGQDMTKLSDPYEISKNFDGIVAWATPKQSEDDDWVRVSMTGYFEDVNTLKFYKDEGGKRTVQAEFKLEKTDKGYALTAIDGTTGEMNKMADGMGGAKGGGDDEMAKQMLAAMKPMFKGMKMGFSVTVPGAVTDSSGFLKTEGRTASMEIRDKDLFDMMEGKKEAAEKFKSVSGTRKVTWAESSVAAEDQAAFKQEIAQAKAEWARLEAEWKAKAEAAKAAADKKKSEKPAPKDKSE